MQGSDWKNKNSELDSEPGAHGKKPELVEHEGFWKVLSAAWQLNSGPFVSGSEKFCSDSKREIPIIGMR